MTTLSSATGSKKVAVLDAEPPKRRAVPRAPGPRSALTFDAYPQMDEVVAFAGEQGWLALGWTELTLVSLELFYSTDGWRSSACARSFDPSAPVQGNRISLAGVAPGTKVSFAVRLGVAAHAPGDIGGFRARGQVWLNNGWDPARGAFRNYDQITA